MDGFINFLKPAGMTSSDAVLAVRKLLPRKTVVGHGGTLDPDAAGVLPVCVGKATRLFDYIIDKQKTYIGEICLGIDTDTFDASGNIVRRTQCDISRYELENALNEFTGEILQVPPMYSALKKDGEPLYKLARKGETLELEPRRVTVYSIQLSEKTAPNRYLLTIRCGKGVYIRSLMHDIGEKLGCGAHMSFLIRSEAGALNVNHAYTLEELRNSGDLSAFITPMDALLGAYTPVRALEEYRMNIMNGQNVLPEWTEGISASENEKVRLYCGSEFAGMGTVTEEGNVKINAMLLSR